jgi:hypothetical protein
MSVLRQRLADPFIALEIPNKLRLSDGVVFNKPWRKLVPIR